jgi:hypothetical protein
MDSELVFQSLRTPGATKSRASGGARLTTSAKDRWQPLNARAPNSARHYAGRPLPRRARQGRDGLPGPRRTSFVRSDDDPDPTPVDFRFPRFAGVSPDAYASDHCPIILDLG